MQGKCATCSWDIKQGKYCSRLCYHISTRGKYNKGHENLKKTQYKKGQSGFIFKSREVNCKICEKGFIAFGPKALFCSSKCKEAGRPEKQKRNFICKFCQKPFKRRAPNNAGHFCSRECCGLFIMAHGDGHYVYKAMLLLERKCKICSFDDLNVLCVHHIDGNRRNNDISNLEILCANCHFKMHFGNGKIRRKKIDQIIKYQERINAFKIRFFKKRNKFQH